MNQLSVILMEAIPKIVKPIMVAPVKIKMSVILMEAIPKIVKPIMVAPVKADRFLPS